MRRSLDSGLPGGPSTGRSAAPAHAAARRSLRAARATRTGSRTGAPSLPGRRAGRAFAGRNPGVRAPHLHSALRSFCLGSFAFFGREIEEGAEIQFVFEEHGSRDRPTLYEYRPLVRSFVEARGGRLLGQRDTRIALEALGREPAAGSTRALTPEPRGARPLSHGPAAAPGRRGGGLRRVRLGRRGVRPGLCEPRAVALRRGARVRGRRAARGDRGRRDRRARRRDSSPARGDGELAAHWPDAARLRPGELRPGDRPHVRARARAALAGRGRAARRAGRDRRRRHRASPRDGGPIAAGPVLFERLDWRPFGVRPVLPIAATQPPGEPTRLDVFRGEIARALLARARSAEDDRELGEALDRWELSLFQDRALPRRAAARAPEALLGAGDGRGRRRSGPPCCSARPGASGEAVARRAPSAGRRGPSDEEAGDLVRRALVETLTRGDGLRLVAELDESLLGRPEPTACGSRCSRSASRGGFPLALGRHQCHICGRPRR